MVDDLCRAYFSREEDDTFIIGTVDLSCVIPRSMLEDDEQRDRFTKRLEQILSPMMSDWRRWAITVAYRDDSILLCMIRDDDSLMIV